MKTNALEYLKHQHCQFRLSEHILSSAYPVIAQIMEEYADLSTNQANGAYKSESTCNLQNVSDACTECGLDNSYWDGICNEYRCLECHEIIEVHER